MRASSEYKALSLFLILTYIIPLANSLGAPIYNADITIFPDGWVDIKMDLDLSGEESNVSIKLDGEPHNLLVQGDGLILNYTLKGLLLTVNPMGSRHLTISYQTPSLTSKNGVVWNLTLDLDVDSLQIFLPKDSVILGMSGIPSTIDLENDWIKITFDTGRIWLAYKTGRLPIAPPKTSSVQLPTEKGGEGITIQANRTVRGNTTPVSLQSRYPNTAINDRNLPENEREQPTDGTPFLIYAIPAILLVMGLLSLLIRKRSIGYAHEEGPDDLEVRILKFLEERGGQAMQSDIIKAVDAPRTTVWRRLRKMERDGKVKLYKDGKYTVVRLVR